MSTILALRASFRRRRESSLDFTIFDFRGTLDLDGRCMFAWSFIKTVWIVGALNGSLLSILVYAGEYICQLPDSETRSMFAQLF